MNVLRLHTYNGYAQEPFQNHVIIKEQKTTIDVEKLWQLAERKQNRNVYPAANEVFSL